MKDNVKWLALLHGIKGENPRLFDKLIRYLLTHMGKRKLVSLDDLEREVSETLGDADDASKQDPNRPAPRMSAEAVEVLDWLVIRHALQSLPENEAESLLRFAHVNELAIEIGRLADDTHTPFTIVADKLKANKHIFLEEQTMETADILGTRVALIRRFITEQLEFINIAKHYMRIPDLAELVENIIVPGDGNGKIGGKGAGLFLAWCILREAQRAGRIEMLPLVPRTKFIRSDGILQFIAHNNLEECTNIKYRPAEEIQSEYPLIEKIFKSAQFPDTMLAGLTQVLEQFEGKPIIVRSSSLLEDRIGSAFSGKYKSLFLANQGSLAQRLDELTNAVAEIYAGTFSPDAIIYRRERGLLDFQEEMGVLIQEVVGDHVGRYYFPAYAGVALTHNEIRWSPRIERKDGVVRLVTGLGTRAVDRVYDDYAYLMSPGKPNLKTGFCYEEILRHSQRLIDVIDTEKGYFETVPLTEILRENKGNFPRLNMIVSVDTGGSFSVPVGILLNENPDDLAVTFDGLMKSPFPRLTKSYLDQLTESYRRPVELEFAVDRSAYYLLQCRTQNEASTTGPVKIPAGIMHENKVFSACRFVQNGMIENIEYIVYIDPADYEAVENFDTLLAVGRCVGNLNRALPRRKFILMGPGRWGSRGEIKLGVRVNYSDINNTSLLIEIARKKGNYLPEVSFGTHFFQDLVESDIRYLPLYPDDEEVVFNQKVLVESPNVLPAVVPEFAHLENVVRVIQVPAIMPGQVLHVAMDADADQALAWIGIPQGRTSGFY